MVKLTYIRLEVIHSKNATYHFETFLGWNKEFSDYRMCG